MAELKISNEITIKGTPSEIVQIMTGLEKAQQLAKEPVNVPIVGRLAVITKVDTYSCLLGFKKGDVVRVLEYQTGTSIPFKVRKVGLFESTGWARRDEVSFIKETL